MCVCVRVFVSFCANPIQIQLEVHIVVLSRVTSSSHLWFETKHMNEQRVKCECECEWRQTLLCLKRTERTVADRIKRTTTTTKRYQFMTNFGKLFIGQHGNNVPLKFTFSTKCFLVVSPDATIFGGTSFLFAGPSKYFRDEEIIWKKMADKWHSRKYNTHFSFALHFRSLCKHWATIEFYQWDVIENERYERRCTHQLDIVSSLIHFFALSKSIRSEWRKNHFHISI